MNGTTERNECGRGVLRAYAAARPEVVLPARTFTPELRTGLLLVGLMQDAFFGDLATVEVPASDT